MAKDTVYHILCGYNEPAIISCREEHLAKWLEIGTKDSFLVHDLGTWMETGGVIVIRGDVVSADELQKFREDQQCLI